MTDDWRTLSPEALEAQFNPRLAVADAPEWIETYARAGESARAAIGPGTSLRYGEAAEARLSLYCPAQTSESTPLVIAVHGGYWRALSRQHMDLVAPPLLQSGIAVATIDHTLCPGPTLDTLVAQVGAATRWLSERASRYGVDPQRIWLLGHSAGAHLAAKVLYDEPGGDDPPVAVRGAVLVSGIYDLEPVRWIGVNSDIGLDEAAARNNSVRIGPTPRRPLTQLVGVGEKEPPLWIGQSRSFHEQAMGAGIDSRWHTLPGHHFSCLMVLNDPLHAFTRAVIAAVLADEASG